MAWLLDEGHATFEEAFGAFMGLVYGAMMAANAFAFTGDLGKAKVSCHDMFELLDRKSQIDGLSPIGQTPDMGEGFDIGHFEFEGVCFHYPFRKDVQVLNKMSFSIAAGTSVGVVGPSGGGKSTVMAMIQRFYDPQEGAIYIGSGNNRLPLNSVNIRWWRRQVGFVGQEPILFGGSVLENVKYGLDEGEAVSDDHLQKCKEDSFLTFLDNAGATGWETQVGPRGSRLSGGQKQRVAICRALIRNPRVILLDEATSALDSQSERVVNKALERARKGRTSFAIAHRLSTIQDCDVIIVVANGVIVEQGSHRELLQKGGVYHKLSSATDH
jgi:ATP-binding cassette subfamily B (MDR/TAP) protein 1